MPSNGIFNRCSNTSPPPSSSSSSSCSLRAGEEDDDNTRRRNKKGMMMTFVQCQNPIPKPTHSVWDMGPPSTSTSLFLSRSFTAIILIFSFSFFLSFYFTMFTTHLNLMRVPCCCNGGPPAAFHFPPAFCMSIPFTRRPRGRI